MIRREACWRLVPELTVRRLLVVLHPEVLDDDPGLGKRPQLLAIEALVTEASVEQFHKASIRNSNGQIGEV